jgi:hypothetical protein
MVSWKIWTGCSIKLENKPYQYGLTGNIRDELKLETTGNINNKTLKLVPLLPREGILAAISIFRTGIRQHRGHRKIFKSVGTCDSFLGEGAGRGLANYPPLPGGSFLRLKARVVVRAWRRNRSLLLHTPSRPSRG